PTPPRPCRRTSFRFRECALATLRVDASLLPAEPRQAVATCGVVGIRFNRLLIGAACVGIAADLFEHGPLQAVGACQPSVIGARAERDGATREGNRLVVLLELVVEPREKIVSVGVRRIDSDAALESRQRLVIAPLIHMLAPLLDQPQRCDRVRRCLRSDQAEQRFRFSGNETYGRSLRGAPWYSSHLLGRGCRFAATCGRWRKLGSFADVMLLQQRSGVRCGGTLWL